MKRVERSLPESITLVYSDKEFSLTTHIAQERSPVLADLIADNTDGEYRIPLPVDGVEYLIDYLLTGNFPTDSYSFIYLIHYLNIDFPFMWHVCIVLLWNKREEYEGFNQEEQICLKQSFYAVIPPRVSPLSLKQFLFDRVFPTLPYAVLFTISRGSAAIYSTVFEYLLKCAKAREPSLLEADSNQAVLAFLYLQHSENLVFKTKMGITKRFPQITNIIQSSKGYTLHDCIIFAAISNCLHLCIHPFKSPSLDLQNVRLSFQRIYAHRHDYKMCLIYTRECTFEAIDDAYQRDIARSKEKKNFNVLYEILPLEKFKEYVNSLAPPDKE